jgi:hypothetical protein
MQTPLHYLLLVFSDPGLLAPRPCPTGRYAVLDGLANIISDFGKKVKRKVAIKAQRK